MAILTEDNPEAAAGAIRLYADQFCTYAEAAANLDREGVICMHPRTGSPIDNPYLKIRTAAYSVLRKSRLDSGRLWEAISPKP